MKAHHITIEHIDKSFIYGDKITEAPVITSQFDTAEFHYFKDGKKIKVAVCLSTKNDDALAIFVGIVT